MIAAWLVVMEERLHMEALILLQILKPAHVVASPLNGEPDFVADAAYLLSPLALSD